MSAIPEIYRCTCGAWRYPESKCNYCGSLPTRPEHKRKCNNKAAIGWCAYCYATIEGTEYE